MKSRFVSLLLVLVMIGVIGETVICTPIFSQELDQPPPHTATLTVFTPADGSTFSALDDDVVVRAEFTVTNLDQDFNIAVASMVAVVKLNETTGKWENYGPGIAGNAKIIGPGATDTLLVSDFLLPDITIPPATDLPTGLYRLVPFVSLGYDLPPELGCGYYWHVFNPHQIMIDP